MTPPIWQLTRSWRNQRAVPPAVSQGTFGSAACTAGQHRVYTAAECSSAAAALGKVYYNSVSWAPSARGCWVCRSDCAGGFANKVLFNQVGGDDFDAREAPVCKNGT